MKLDFEYGNGMRLALPRQFLEGGHPDGAADAVLGGLVKAVPVLGQAGGVRDRLQDILLLFSNGLHPRATVPEMKTILGEELFREFYYTNQITSHDSEDYDRPLEKRRRISFFSTPAA